MSNPTAAKPARSINPKHNRKRSKKGRGALIAIIISVVLIGAFAALLFLNIYNIRDMMFDRIAGVPLIGALVPESEGGERVPRVSASDLQSRIDLLQRQLDSATRDRDNLRVENEGLKRENERLTGFEEWQEQFKLDMETFATGLITDDPMAFWQIVLQMDPDLVTELAREASGDAQRAKEVRDYIRMISDMDLKSASAAMEVLMDTDSGMVRDIMLSLNNTHAAGILDGMEVQKRAALLRLMYPEGL